MRLNRYLFATLLALLLFGSVSKSFASHLRSADVIIERTSDPLTFHIKLVVYTNTASGTAFGRFNGWLNFGDGQVLRLPETAATPRPDLGKNIGVVVLEYDHPYAAHGTYKVTYQDGDRNANINNMDNSIDQEYSIYVEFNTLDMAKNTLPVLTIPPLDKGCPANTFTHNAGVKDAQGDSISYNLVTPRGDLGLPIDSWLSPDNPKYYIDYEHANEAGNGRPHIKIDSISGTLTWDAPGNLGEYAVAFQIQEWRKDPATDKFVLLSTTVRDMQILVEACENARPTLVVPANACVIEGTIFNEKIKGFDKEKGLVKMEAVSELFTLPTSPAIISPTPFDYRTAAPKYDSLNFYWSTTCEHVRRQAYSVVFKITDKPVGATPLATLKSWSILVMAPAPVWKSHTLDLVKRYAILKWKPYTCANANKIQIWRRVDNYPYIQPLCEVGIPKVLDFDLVGEVSGSDTTFVDTNFNRRLVDGAQYCYRLVAVFSGASVTSSKVSTDVCFDPIVTDAPVITHVSVEKTHKEEGSIRVSWRKPFKINKTQFPEPYHYHIFRAYGFLNEPALQEVGIAVNDTTYLDPNINTLDSAFNYRIILYAKPDGANEFGPIDTSAIASSVRLTLTPGLHMMNLAWRDSVPWSNVVLTNPWHVIYRGENGGDLVKYDSVDISLNGGLYTDINIDDETYYSYRVKTRGTYGNPSIALLENYSQIASDYPINNLVVCKPQVTVVMADCKSFEQGPCVSIPTVENLIHWHAVVDTGCKTNIEKYRVYASDTASGNYVLLTTTLDTTFTEKNLHAFARCYRVTAIDAKGEEGPMSDPVCNDNCPSFELPNIFTPNGDGCNDLFSTYNGATGNVNCPASLKLKCSRFVASIDLIVMNRWGKEVYRYYSGGDNPVTINWNGNDKHNNLLEDGQYFYQASVVFNVFDPKSRYKKYKGIVQIAH